MTSCEEKATNYLVLDSSTKDQETMWLLHFHYFTGCPFYSIFWGIIQKGRHGECSWFIILAPLYVSDSFRSKLLLFSLVVWGVGLDNYRSLSWWTKVPLY